MISAVSYQFERFVEFAEERVKAGKDTAIATKGDVKVGGGTPLEERAISPSRPGIRSAFCIDFATSHRRRELWYNCSEKQRSQS